MGASKVKHGGLSPDELDAVFAALSDRTRRQLLSRMAGGESTVRELSRGIAMSEPAISRHLRVLEQAGLMNRRISGREHLCRMEPKAMEKVAEWIELHRRFWNERLDGLEEYLKMEEEKRDP